MSLNFNCSYMVMSSSTNLPFFYSKFIQIKHIMKKKITSKSSAKKFELKWSLVDQLSKLFVPLPISINFRGQIENQVSDYRLLGASSFPSVPWYFPFLPFRVSTHQNHWISYFFSIPRYVICFSNLNTGSESNCQKITSNSIE